MEEIPWHTNWKKWDNREIFESTSINVIGQIVCPDLRYNERTVKKIAQRIISDITPVSSYIQVNKLLDT